MVSIYDVKPRKLIEAIAKELKKKPEMAPPEWAMYVKTGVSRERPPVEKDWWYIRSAAVLRSVYKLGPIGVSKLRTKYGGRKNRGHAPDRAYKASGNILRKILQKLEILGYIKQDEKGVHKGRVITPEGKSFVDKIVVKTKEPYKPKKKQAEEKKKETEKAEKKPAKEKPKEESKKQEKTVEKEAKKEEPKEEKKTKEKPAETKKEEKTEKEPKKDKPAPKKEDKKEEKTEKKEPKKEDKPKKEKKKAKKEKKKSKKSDKK